MESYCLPFSSGYPIADASEDALAAREETFNAFLPGKNIALLPHSLSALSACANEHSGKYRLRYSGSCGCVFLMIDVLDFKEVRDHMGAPVF